MTAEPSAARSDDNPAALPIALFDSGVGGLTVLDAMRRLMPEEDYLFLGDTARVPYGAKSPKTIIRYTLQAAAKLIGLRVKLLVIACNTATAAGLAHAQRVFPVPVVGVVEPGARAAAHTTLNRRVGVIATKGTVDSNAYSDAIRHIDAGITVFSTATPRFVEIAEMGLKMADGPIEDYLSEAAKVYIRPEFEEIAREYLEPLRRCEIDTLVLGCTHYPLLEEVIAGIMGPEVALVSAGEESAFELKRLLTAGDLRTGEDREGELTFYVSDRTEDFERVASVFLQEDLRHAAQWVDIDRY